MTQPTSTKVINLGTPFQKLKETMDAAENYFFIGVTEEGAIAYSVSLNEPKWEHVTILNIYLDHIKDILVDQYEWLPMEGECDD